MLRVLVIFLLLSSNAYADDYLKGMSKVGEGTLSWLFWDAYKAELYSASGKYDQTKDFALELEYKMDFTGKEIAERSVEEIRGQGSASEAQLAKWYKSMEAIFPNVQKGDVLLGRKNDAGVIFKYNGRKIGSIEDPTFAKAFFDIWLGEKTSEPGLRKKLLAGK